MKTVKVNTTISHSLELLSNLIRGLNVADIEQMQLNAMSDGTRALVQFKGMLYSLEARPLFEAVDESPTKPTLQHIWNNEVNHCHEKECDECDSCEVDDGDFHSPPMAECTETDAICCPAAARVYGHFMREYDEQMESINHV